MRVLHVSNFGDRHNGRLFWNHCFKISNGFTRNGHSVYNFSDRDQSRSSIINKLNNNKNVQKSLIDVNKNYNPDLIVLGHADRIHNETLELIKRNNKDVKIIEWNVDNYHLDQTENKLTSRSSFIDGFFITTADEKISSCINNNFISFFPNIVDKSIERLKIFDLNKHSGDVFFALSHGVGTGILRKKNTVKENFNPRVQILDHLTNESNDIKYRFYGYKNIQPIWANEFESKIKDCYMGLCLQRKPQLKYCLSDRVSQYAGNGLMIFIEHDTMFYDFLEDGKEAVYFNDKSELSEKIKFYKINKIKALEIAKNGHKKLHKFCNETIVTNYFIDCLNGEREEALNSKYNWPIHIYR